MPRRSSASIDNFFAQYPVLTYEKDQVIIHGQDTPNGVFLVKEGFVKMNSISEDGKEVTLNIFKPRSYFPIIWALTEIPNNYFYQTISPVSVHKAPKDDFLKFIEENPQALFQVTKRILKRMKRILINFENQLSGDSYKKIVSSLIFASKRFEKAIPLTHQEIADMAGITRETASLAIEDLAKKGLIRAIDHKIIVKDLEALEKEIS